MNLLNDIYYSKDYISLYLKDNEEIFEFSYKEGEYIFYNLAIKRPILKIKNVKVDDGYFDLETVYGYGGFYANTDDFSFISNALKKYEEKCKKERIIAEFLRFHPFNKFSQKFATFFDLNIYDREIVYVDLNLSKEDRWKNYSSKVRNILRKCEKELVFSKTNDIEFFMKLYEETMAKNNASSFYYFDKEYYQKLLNNENIELYCVKKDNKVISISFFMFSNDFGHYHLSANDYSMRQFNANYYMLDQIFEIGRQKQIKYFILGGGTTSMKDDSLLSFKQKFSIKTKPFFISGKVFNKNIYEQYIKLWENQSKENIKYFLKYRLELD